jgi:putative transcriptional regulator
MKIKEMRKKKRWTQEELAKRVGCTRAYISKVENEKANPTKEILSRIAEALGTELKKVV